MSLTRGKPFMWRGRKRGEGTYHVPGSASRYPGLDDYILDALSSYYETEVNDLYQRVRDSYGTVTDEALRHHVQKLVRRGDIIRVDRAVYKRRRGAA